MNIHAVMTRPPEKATRWKPVESKFPGRHRQTPDDATLLAARDAGWTIAGMSTLWKLSPTTLRSHFVRLKAAMPDGRVKRETRRDKGTLRGRYKVPCDDQLIADLLAEKSIAEMALSYGCSEQTLRRYLGPLEHGKTKPAIEVTAAKEVVASAEFADTGSSATVHLIRSDLAPFASVVEVERKAPSDDRIIADRQSGMSTRAMAKAYGTSQPAIMQHLRRLGLSVRKNAQVKAAPSPVENIAGPTPDIVSATVFTDVDVMRLGLIVRLMKSFDLDAETAAAIVHADKNASLAS